MDHQNEVNRLFADIYRLCGTPPPVPTPTASAKTNPTPTNTDSGVSNTLFGDAPDVGSDICRDHAEDDTPDIASVGFPWKTDFLRTDCNRYRASARQNKYGYYNGVQKVEWKAYGAEDFHAGKGTPSSIS